MASSPAKRRKLSPEASTPQSAPTTPSRPPVARDAARVPFSRPSFASPTKASIARHNPQLLARPPAASMSNGRDNASQTIGIEPLPAELLTGKDARPDAAESQNPMTMSEEGQGEPPPEVEAPAAGGGTSKGRSTRSTTSSLSAPPRRGLRTPVKDMSKPPIPVDTLPESTKANEASVPFRSAGLGRSPIASQSTEPLPTIRPREQEEPELPLTPTQRGLADPVVTTPPSGIHNTPNKRPKKSRGGKPKPSPLKPQSEAEKESKPEAEVEPELERPVKRPRTSEFPSRDIVPFDPYVEKKRVRNELIQEVKRLQADIALAEQENYRQHQYHFLRKGSAEPPNPDDILSLLIRSTLESVPKPPPPKPTSILHTISSFLPFATRPRPPIITSPKEEPPLSHLPVILEDQLPHLQLFTPLTYTSTITLLPPAPPAAHAISSTSILQNHTINIGVPTCLFSARINMIVDTTSFSVSSLSITSLDPNAEAELGSWARERASGKSLLGRDISAICWAMGRWYEVAMRRAKFWYEVQHELGNEEGRMISRARLKEAGRRNRRRGNEDQGEGSDAGDDDGTDGENAKEKKWTRRQLLPHMGRTAMVLTGEGVELRIRWDIIFDWTGEAESSISASAGVPTIWQQEDERDSLAKVPETFDNLVKARGPMAAVRAMVALLMPS